MSKEESLTKYDNFTEGIQMCIKNGNRLMEDSKYLFDVESYASSYMLAKISQEEFAKGFILKLIKDGALKWTIEVRRSLNHHISKQLMILILEFLNPNDDDFEKMIKDYTKFNKQRKVYDAINIYVHEILRRWESQNWDWLEDPIYDKKAEFIYKGKEDKIKQNATYIKILKDGQAINSPTEFKKENAAKEIESAERYEYFLNIRGDLRYKKIVYLFEMLKLDIP